MTCLQILSSSSKLLVAMNQSGGLQQVKRKEKWLEIFMAYHEGPPLATEEYIYNFPMNLLIHHFIIQILN
jgi:hypothetical protein